MPRLPIVESRAKLEQVRADLAEVLDTSVRLPMSPFRRGAGTYSLCEFEVFRSAKFGAVLEALADLYRDEYVSGAAVEPDIDTYYWPSYGTLAAFRFKAEVVSRAYGEALAYQPGGDITGALLFTSEVLAVAGSSGSWSIWGERELGIAVVWTDRADASWQLEPGPFLPPIEALHSFVEPNFNRHPMPTEFRETFIRNFTS